MKEHRSASQISLGFLPEQTVDLQGRVWKVKEWVDAKPRSVDVTSLRRELEHQVAEWAKVGMDGKYLEHLKGGYVVRLCALNRETGVKVETFPQSWLCKRCSRLYQSGEPEVCICGNKRFGQLPFVGFHDKCGQIQTPYIKPCPQHKQIKCIFPGTARAAEIQFSCPVCGRQLQKGFGFRKCSCGNGLMTFNVHRASSVYTPRSLVMINPPSTEKVQRVRDAGGPNRALTWMLSGLAAKSFDDLELTEDSLRASLARQGLPSNIIEQMIEAAKKGGAIVSRLETINLTGDSLAQAEAGAVNIALALVDSRVQLDDLRSGAKADSELEKKYDKDYPASIRKVGLEAIEFVDSFPVLSGCYGYSRGGHDPGTSQLIPFRNPKNEFVVYGDIVRTEALFVRLDPKVVARWMGSLGFKMNSWSDDRSARLSLLECSSIPRAWEKPTANSPGTKLLTMIHSYAHFFIRKLAVHSGVELNSISEFLIPQHCSFFVYAASRGDFVLGGLQAVFESDLHTFLRDLAQSDLRCALDPGCKRAGGACVACLHLGEPSCRYFNRYLGRETLMGDLGYVASIEH